MILTNSTNGTSALKSTVENKFPSNYNKGKSQEVFPLKKKEDIQKIKDFYLARRRYRDYALFCFGINTGMRCGDMLHLKWSDVLDEQGEILSSFTIREEKTNKFRKIFINQSAAEGLKVFLKSKQHDLTGFIFSGKGTPVLKVNSVYRMYKRTAEKLGININVGTHTIRKTFGYHQYKINSKTDPEFLLRLQKMYKHSSSYVTLAYIGITDEQEEVYYNNVNL